MIRNMMVIALVIASTFCLSSVKATPIGTAPLAKGAAKGSPSSEITVNALPLLADAVHTATEIKFYRNDNQGELISSPYAVLSEHSHAHFFHLIKATVCRRKSGFTRFTGYTAAFFVGGKQISTVGYYPDLGWLVEPHWQNGQVPDELRKWLCTLATTPKK